MERQITCPHCGASIPISGDVYNTIASQVRDQVISEAVAEAVQAKERELTERHNASVQTLQANLQLQAQQTTSEKDQQIASLTNQITELKKKANDYVLKQRNSFDRKAAEQDSVIAGLQKELSMQKEAQAAAVDKAIATEKEKSRAKEAQIISLQTKVEAAKAQTVLEVQAAVSEHEKTEAELKAQISAAERSRAESESALTDKYESIIKGKDEQIAYYKDFRAKQSVKVIGESLEQHCQSSVNAIRSLVPTLYFEKDNTVSPESGSKGDFILRDYTDDGTEFISIMFEMKNENETSTHKHKNEDFFPELDKDRREKGCEYAVLVSMLEPESELYNQGIVDVSYKYPKMYAIRPQFLVPIITILRQAAMNTVEYRKEIRRLHEENVDVTTFEDSLKDYTESISRNYALAAKNRSSAVSRIDKTIDTLQQIKKDLESMDKHMLAAENKAEKLTIRKLTKNAPTVKALIDASAKEEKPVDVTSKEILDDEKAAVPVVS